MLAIKNRIYQDYPRFFIASVRERKHNLWSSKNNHFQKMLKFHSSISEGTIRSASLPILLTNQAFLIDSITLYDPLEPSAVTES
jgi:hypothetical protein